MRRHGRVGSPRHFGGRDAPGAQAASPHLPTTRAETKEFIRQQMIAGRGGKMKKDASTMVSNVNVAHYRPLELFCRLAYMSSRVDFHQSTELDAWAEDAAPVVEHYATQFEAGMLDEDLEEREGRSGIEKVVRFAHGLVQHLIAKGYTLGTLSLETSDVIEQQAKQIAALQAEVRDTRYEASNTLEAAKVQHREDLRYEVANAVNVTKQEFTTISSKELSEVRNENATLHNRVAELRLELAEMRGKNDSLFSEVLKAQNEVDMMKTAFEAIQRVKDCIREDTLRECHAQTHDADSQTSRLNATIAMQARQIKEYNEQLKEAERRHQVQSDKMIQRHEEGLAQLRSDCAALQKQKDEMALSHLDLIGAHRDATKRQASVLAHLARNNLSMIERQYKPSEVSFAVKPPPPPPTHPTQRTLTHMVRTAMKQSRQERARRATSATRRSQSVGFVNVEDLSGKTDGVI